MLNWLDKQVWRQTRWGRGGCEFSLDRFTDNVQIFKKYQIKKSVEQSGLETELGVTNVLWKLKHGCGKKVENEGLGPRRRHVRAGGGEGPAQKGQLQCGGTRAWLGSRVEACPRGRVWRRAQTAGRAGD